MLNDDRESSSHDLKGYKSLIYFSICFLICVLVLSYGSQHSPAAGGVTVRRGQACRKRKEERIKKIENKFDAGDYSLVEYLVLQVEESVFIFT